MLKASLTLGLLLALQLQRSVEADDFARLDQALPSGINIDSIFPVFDMDTDGCLPAAAVSRSGQQNPGLSIGGSVTRYCRNSNFLDLSNTYHRFSCINVGSNEYCAHMFGLYFEKDQIFRWFGGHTNDWEHVLIYATNGVVTHVGTSAHGDYDMKSFGGLDLQNGHVKIVYHKEGLLTHALRFAKSNEIAENGYGTFVTPAIVSWETFTGDGVSNSQMKSKLNSFNYGSAHLDLKDSRFFNQANGNAPAGYPIF